MSCLESEGGSDKGGDDGCSSESEAVGRGGAGDGRGGSGDRGVDSTHGGVGCSGRGREDLAAEGGRT